MKSGRMKDNEIICEPGVLTQKSDKFRDFLDLLETVIVAVVWLT
jgi:hypothetical protein